MGTSMAEADRTYPQSEILATRGSSAPYCEACRGPAVHYRTEGYGHYARIIGLCWRCWGDELAGKGPGGPGPTGEPSG